MNIGKFQILWHNPFKKYTDMDELYDAGQPTLYDKEPPTIGIVWYFPTFGYRFNALSGIYSFVIMIGYLDIRKFK